MKISVIIATRNRARALKEFSLPSLASQDFSDFEVIVWDASDNDDSKIVVEEFSKKNEGIDMKYFKAPRKGLTCQRNDAVAYAKGDIILFIDDDISLSPNSLKEIDRFYCEDTENLLGGLEGEIFEPNRKTGIRRIFRKIDYVFRAIFLLSRTSERYKKVLLSGWAVGFPPNFKYPENSMKDGHDFCYVEWLSGVCMSYRRKIFSEYGLRFDEDLAKLGGYSFMEDVDFSYRVHRLGFKLVRTNTFQAIHYRDEAGRMNWENLQRQRVFNHFLVWYKNIDKSILSILAFVWSEIGLFLHTVLRTIKRSIKNKDFSVLKGHLDGYKYIIRYLRNKKIDIE